MSALDRCVGVYRPSWDLAVRCSLRSRHKGPCGPSKPALAQEHSQPSTDAAAAIEPVRGALRVLVYQAIKGAGTAGMTDEQGCTATAIGPSTYRPRRIELVESGAVRDSGRTRAGKSGRKMTVWIAQ